MADAPVTAKPPLLIERDAGVTTLRINDETWNRMSLEFMDELERVVDELARDDSVRAIAPVQA